MSGVLLDFYCWPGDLPTVGLMRTHIWWMAMAFCLLVLIRIRGKSFNRSIAAVLVFVPLGGLLHQHQITSHQRAGIWEYLSATDQPTIISGIVDQPPNLVYHNVAPGHRRSSWQTQMEVQLTKLESRTVLHIGKWTFVDCHRRTLRRIPAMAMSSKPMAHSANSRAPVIRDSRIFVFSISIAMCKQSSESLITARSRPLTDKPTCEIHCNV